MELPERSDWGQPSDSRAAGAARASFPSPRDLMYANAGAVRPGTIEDLNPPGKGGGEPTPLPLAKASAEQRYSCTGQGLFKLCSPGGSPGRGAGKPRRSFYRNLGSAWCWGGWEEPSGILFHGEIEASPGPGQDIQVRLGCAAISLQ